MSTCIPKACKMDCINIITPQVYRIWLYRRLKTAWILPSSNKSTMIICFMKASFFFLKKFTPGLISITTPQENLKYDSVYTQVSRNTSTESIVLQSHISCIWVLYSVKKPSQHDRIHLDSSVSQLISNPLLVSKNNKVHCCYWLL